MVAMPTEPAQRNLMVAAGLAVAGAITVAWFMSRKPQQPEATPPLQVQVKDAPTKADVPPAAGTSAANPAPVRTATATGHRRVCRGGMRR